MDDAFRQAALDYHRLPRPGKLAIEPTKRMASQRDLSLAYSPGRRRGLRRDQGRSRHRPRLHRARQPGRRDLQRHRRARPRQHRRAGRQAGDGGQGRPVQEVRRHRRVRHRGGRRRPGPLLRRRRGAGTDLRRHQPGGHQGPRVLRDRGRVARAAWASRCSTTTSTAPPSPSPPRCATACCCRSKSLSDARLVTSGAGAAALACVDLLVAMGLRPENVTLTDINGVVRRDRPGMLPNMARYARDTHATHAWRGAGRRRRLPGPVRAAAC